MPGRVVRLETPLTPEDVATLRAGDIVYLSGVLVTARDEAHKRIIEVLESGGRLPVDLRGGVIYHCGPVVRRSGDSWEVVAAGPTTSYRMSALVPRVAELAGVKAFIGKGGLSPEASRRLAEAGAVYLAYPGGAAVLAAKSIVRVVDVHWLDLGVPEAMWVLEVRDFGPLTVAVDVEGRSLYEEVEGRVRAALPAAARILEERIRSLQLH